MLQALFGIFVLCFLAWLFSQDRRRFPWRLVGVGVLLQFVLAVLFLKVPVLSQLVLHLGEAAHVLENASRAGSGFLFGYLGGGPLPFEEISPGKSFIIAFQVLPMVVVMCAFSAVLFHWGIIPWCVRTFAWFLSRTLGTGGAMGLGVAANIFLGIIEAPIVIKPYLKKMSQSELFTVLTSGMATIAGTVWVLYAAVLEPVLANAASQLLIASLLSAPAAVVIAQILIPQPKQAAQAIDTVELPKYHNWLEALVQGAQEGVQMVLGIVGVLLVLFAAIFIINYFLALFPISSELTLQTLFGLLFTPLCWVIGIPWEEAFLAGKLMATKTVLNEFVAYTEMAQEGPHFSERTRLILTYALCGFANFGSLGILIGGLGSVLPERRQEIAALGFRAILAGTLATMMTGAIIGAVSL